MLALGALFISFSTEYAEVTYSLLFGEVYGVSQNVLAPIAGLGGAAVALIAVMYRPLLLASALPEIADARGVSTRRMELCYLLVMALAASMTVPVVGFFLAGSGWTAVRRGWSAPRPALAPAP
jgi:zinc/manganese transport system permease protein